MFRRFQTGTRQQVISVSSGMATLLCALIWAAFGALVPEAGGAHIDTADAVRSDGIDAAVSRDMVEAWMDTADQDEDGYYIADQFHLPLIAESFRFVPDRVVLEAGKQYFVQAASTDVSHGIRFQLPQGGSRTWAISPGHGGHFLIEFTEPGTYTAVCDIFCGIGHHEMTMEIKVVEDLSEVAVAAAADDEDEGEDV